MKNDVQQQLAGCAINDAESWKAFHQMYNTQATYGNGFDKDFQNYHANFLQHFAPYVNPMVQSSFSPSSSSTSSTSSQQNPSKKKPVPVPEDKKDEFYYERRRRNNDAARKSREARKKIDSDNGARVAQLEAENAQCFQENAQLRAYVHALMAENAFMKQRIDPQYPGFITGNPTTLPVGY